MDEHVAWEARVGDPDFMADQQGLICGSEAIRKMRGLNFRNVAANPNTGSAQPVAPTAKASAIDH